jgi:hypothetical protein
MDDPRAVHDAAALNLEAVRHPPSLADDVEEGEPFQALGFDQTAQHFRVRGV